MHLHTVLPPAHAHLGRYTWRRGSVPLWWTVTIRNGGMGEAEIKIRTTNTFRGSRRYVRRLQVRWRGGAPCTALRRLHCACFEALTPLSQHAAVDAAQSATCHALASLPAA